MKIIRLLMTTCVFLYPGFLAAMDHMADIKVGLTASLTGQYSQQGKSLLQGATMWANDINARGALLGRKVMIVHYDDKSDPSTSAELYDKLITEDKVDMLIGPYSSDVTMAVAPVVEKYNFPMVSGTAAATRIWQQGYRNIFQADVPAPTYMHKGLELTKAKSVGIIFQQNLFTLEVAEGAKAKANELGLKVTVFEPYPRDKTDFSDLIKRLKDSNTELLLGASYLDDSIAIVKEAKAQNFNPRGFAFTSGPSLNEFGKALGNDADGIIGVTPWMRAARKPMAYDFDFRYRSIYGESADSNAAGGYSAGEILEAAARFADSLEKDQLREQLSTMSVVTLMGRYEVDESGMQIGKEMYMMQWQDGKRVLVLPEEYEEEPLEQLVTWSNR